MPAALLNDTPLSLPTVTLITVTSAALAATAQAMRESLREITFGAAIWCSDSPPPADLTNRVQWIRIEPITSRRDYSNFVLRQLVDHVETEHALLVQWDGYVVNPQAWDNAFLSCDYLGAPWPHFYDGLVVGNGGFSLRSRRLLQATAGLPQSEEPEDLAICRTWRHRLEQDHGLVFGSIALAQRFAFERATVPYATFGFHGVFNMPKIIGKTGFREIVRTIDTMLMAPNEIKEMFWWAIHRFDFLLAGQIVLRLIAKWAMARGIEKP